MNHVVGRYIHAVTRCGHDLVPDLRQRLERARVFDMRMSVAQFFRLWADVSFSVQEALGWEIGAHSTPQEAALRTAQQTEFGEHKELPVLPFDDVYFGFGEEVELFPFESKLFRDQWAGLNPRQITTVGVLVCSDGLVVEVLVLREDDLREAYLALLHRNGVFYYGGWSIESVLMLRPWLLHVWTHMAAARVRAGKPKVVKGSELRDLRRAGLCYPPRPYYEVQNTSATKDVVRAMVGQPPEKPLWSHRWDVEGHERVRVLRGSLPVDPEVLADLQRRRYHVYLEPIEDPEDTKRLQVRGEELNRSGEWVALLTTRVNPYIKGPEDKPYIPAVRVVPPENQ